MFYLTLFLIILQHPVQFDRYVRPPVIQFDCSRPPPVLNVPTQIPYHYQNSQNGRMSMQIIPNFRQIQQSAAAYRIPQYGQQNGHPPMQMSSNSHRGPLNAHIPARVAQYRCESRQNHLYYHQNSQNGQMNTQLPNFHQAQQYYGQQNGYAPMQGRQIPHRNQLNGNQRQQHVRKAAMQIVDRVPTRTSRPAHQYAIPIVDPSTGLSIFQNQYVATSGNSSNSDSQEQVLQDVATGFANERVVEDESIEYEVEYIPIIVQQNQMVI